MATWGRVYVYADAETLWDDTARKNPNAWAAPYNLGNLLLRAGRIQEAIGHFAQAAQIKPDYEEAHNNLAFALLQAGKVNDVIAHLEQVVWLKPSFAEAHHGLGVLLDR